MREIRQASGHLSNKGVPKGANYSEGRESVEPLNYEFIMVRDCFCLCCLGNYHQECNSFF